jgi:hypothetical protein
MLKSGFVILVIGALLHPYGTPKGSSWSMLMDLDALMTARKDSNFFLSVTGLGGRAVPSGQVIRWEGPELRRRRHCLQWLCSTRAAGFPGDLWHC